MFLLGGTLEEVAREAARRLGLPQQALLGRS